MKTISAAGFAIMGAGIIAMSFGLARFAFGLFVPPIREELGVSPDVMGLVGSIPFISFCLASLVSTPLVASVGARLSAMVACAFGVAGLALISQSTSAFMLGVGVFSCGICTGLSMPAMAAGTRQAVALHCRGVLMR
jgi:cyanate permease